MTRPLLLSIVAVAACGAAADPGQPVQPGAVIVARTELGELQQLRIDSVADDPRDRDGDVRLYGVSFLGPNQTWRPYCKPDREGRTTAIPVRGSWNARGELVDASDAITFACTSGAIAKCIRFGYKPWTSVDGTSLAPYHAACVRMVRADYCGDGQTHTVDGTAIDIWDRLGVRKHIELDEHPEVFEAAWGPDGAVYLNIPRWSDDVGEIVGECPQRLAGRTSRDRALTPPVVAREQADALLFDGRYVRDADRGVH